MTQKQTLMAGSALAIAHTAAFGAGFQLQERSTVGLGRAFSGEAAVADDASVIASNPAGMIKLDGTSISAGLSYIRPGADASGNSGTTRSSDVGDEVVVPAFYISKKLNDKIAVGIGSFTTYGLSTDFNFNAGFPGPLPDTSTLESVNLQPSIAYRLNEKLTIGAGFNILYADGTINSTVPGGPRVFNLEGDDFGYGYNIGVLYEWSDRTRFGLHYRSKVDLKLDGETDFIGSPNPPLPPLSNQNTTLSVTLPETIEFSAYHEVNDCWAIHGDILYTKWSRYNGLAPRTGTPTDPVFATGADWDNAIRYSLGATYTHSDKWTFRFGAAFDESPISDGDRGLRIPDEDRVWLSAGFSYALGNGYSLDAAYTHIFISDASVEETGFNGTVSGDVDLLSVGISGSF